MQTLVNADNQRISFVLATNYNDEHVEVSIKNITGTATIKPPINFVEVGDCRKLLVLDINATDILAGTYYCELINGSDVIWITEMITIKDDVNVVNSTIEGIKIVN